jgi:tetratricopeptide (TPR) repeat protein
VSDSHRRPLLEQLYRNYLVDQDSASFVRSVAARYTIGTLQRVALCGGREARRAAVLALGFLGGYESNSVLGRALHDEDRGVRIAAENGIRSLWCRDGTDSQRQLLGIVIRLIAAQRFSDAVARATELIGAAPTFAEAWNQRAIALYSLGRYDDSIRDCRQTLELNPYHYGAAAGLGQCYLQLGDMAAALEAFRHALRLNPNLEGVRANVAHLERIVHDDG